MSKNSQRTKKIVNRRATFDYVIVDILTVGMVLSGAETKSLRLGHGQLQGAYVTIKDGELWLVNATINGAPGVPVPEDQITRSRKLLAKQSEINKLVASKQQGSTIVPLEILTSSHFVKLKIATAKGKRQYDKRQSLKARDENRNINASLKQRRPLN